MFNGIRKTIDRVFGGKEDPAKAVDRAFNPKGGGPCRGVNDAGARHIFETWPRLPGDTGPATWDEHLKQGPSRKRSKDRGMGR